MHPMVLPEITWQDVVEAWRFGEAPDAPRHERATERLPVRVAGDVVGEIELAGVFRAG